MGVSSPARFLRFGPFQLDVRAAELRRNGTKIRVPDQSITVLMMLVQSSGEIVTRPELHQKLWPNGTIVEFDNGINAAIKRLREALEDSAEEPRFIETLPRRGYRFLVPVVQVASEESPPTSLGGAERSDGLVGQTISKYRIVKKLGQGAMGVVYQADDIELVRSVAVKFLHDALSDDPRALERFGREARAASALNHPNICAVYEVGRHEGRPFIAMEYVSGKSLDQLIMQDGLPSHLVLNYAAQMTDALAAAHSAGVVHRDLKPSNVIVSQDGLAKLLDFGLAKVCPPAGVDLTAPPAETPLTGEGTILGTLQYMAPEQLEGREADPRTDIFALGAVIYEMATGLKAFEGKSQASLIAAILERHPLPISSVRPMAATGLDRIVATCLAKKPGDRWQSARDLLRELQWLTEGREPQAEVVAGLRASRVLPWVLFAATLVALVALATVHYRYRTGETSLVRFKVPLPPTGRPWQDFPAVSPDGRLVAFSSYTADDKLRLWIYSLASMTTRQLPEVTEGASRPFWSPDSRFIAFFSRDTNKVDDRLHFYLKRIDVTTGVTQTVCETQDPPGSGSWSKDGVILFSQAGFTGSDIQPSMLYRVPAVGGEVRPVLRLDASRQERSLIEPQFLPDGRHFLYRSVAGPEGRETDAIYAASLDSKETQLVAALASNARFVPPGFLLFGRQETLFAQPFNAQKLQLFGEPVLVDAEQVARRPSPAAVSLFSASQNGVLVHVNAVSPNVQLAWYKRDGARLGSVGEPGQYGNMRISPDETKLALDRADDRTGLRDVWAVQLSSGIFTRVTFGPGNNIGPEWSPDGREVAFSSDRRVSGLYDVYRKPIGGGNDELLVVSDDQSRTPQQWFRDGSILLNSWGGQAVAGHNLFYRLPLLGDHKLVLLRRGNKEYFSDDAPMVSSDGRCAAYYSDESGRTEVYLASFPSFQEARRVSDSGGGAPMWRKDGKELFYVTPDGKFMSVAVKCGLRPTSGVPKFLFQLPFPVDIRWIVYSVADNGNTFILGEPVDKDRSLTVVLNWTAGIKR
jgi:eukaryotic-like serine/threonine-protein kinase